MLWVKQLIDHDRPAMLSGISTQCEGVPGTSLLMLAAEDHNDVKPDQVDNTPGEGQWMM